MKSLNTYINESHEERWWFGNEHDEKLDKAMELCLKSYNLIDDRMEEIKKQEGESDLYWQLNSVRGALHNVARSCRSIKTKK